MLNSKNFIYNFKELLKERIDIGDQGKNRLNAVSQRSEKLFNFLKENNLLDKEKINQNFYNEIDIFLQQQYLNQTSHRFNSSNDPLSNISNLFLSTPQPKYLSELTTNLSYQVRKEVINDLKKLIDQHFSLPSYESSENYSTPDTKFHQSPSSQTEYFSTDNKTYNQDLQENYTSLKSDKFDASSYYQQDPAIQFYQQYQRSQNLYDVYKNNKEFQLLRSSLGIINTDLQRDFVEFENIHAESENFYPFSHEKASSKLHDFQTIINLCNSIHNKTRKAFTILDQLLDNGFIDFKTYDHYQKALGDGLSIFRDNFETTTLEIFKGLVNANYYHQYDCNPYDQLKTLNALFAINKTIQEDNSIFFSKDLRDICRYQFDEAIASFFKENFYALDRLESYFKFPANSEQKEFKKFMEEKARTQNQSIYFNQSQPDLSSFSPYQVNQTDSSSYNPPSNSITLGNAQRLMKLEKQIHSPILDQSR